MPYLTLTVQSHPSTQGSHEGTRDEMVETSDVTMEMTFSSRKSSGTECILGVASVFTFVGC